MTESNQTKRLALALRRRAWLIALIFALVTATTAVVSVLLPDRYAASASLLFRDPQFDQQLFGSSFVAPSRDPARDAATNAELVSLDVVAARAARRLGAGFDARRVSEIVDISAEGQSDVVTITGSNGDPEMAARIANVFAAQYIAYRRQADRAKIDEARTLVSRQLGQAERDPGSAAQTSSLRRRASELDILSSLQTGNAELAQPALAPEDPVSPNIVQNVLLGAFAGLFLGLGAAVLLERLDRRMRDAGEVEEILGLPLLGVISQSDPIGAQPNTVEGLPARDAEAFQMLRANLRYFNVDRTIRSVVVTSDGPGEGKSTVTWDLAAAAAASGDTVLVIDADLRKPSLAEYHGLPAASGLSSVLAGESSFEGAIEEIALDAGSPGRSHSGSFSVLPAGPIPPNPTTLLESERLRVLLHGLEGRFDIVLIDTPPIGVVADAIPLLREVSGGIIVSRLGRSTRDGAERLRDQLGRLDAHILGVVVNGLEARRGGYGYGYYTANGYGGPDRARDKAPAPTTA